MSAPRCKPGDLAVVVSSKAGNAGLIVEVLRAAPFQASMLPENGYRYEAGGPAWVIKSIGSLLKHTHGEPSPWACLMDSCLRPINNPGDDEVDEISVRRVIPEGVPA